MCMFIGAFESVNPATRDMQPHYSSEDTAGIKALRVHPLNLHLRRMM